MILFKKFLKEQSNRDSELVKLFSPIVLKHRHDFMSVNDMFFKHLKDVFEKDFNDNDELKLLLNKPTSLFTSTTYIALSEHKAISVKAAVLAFINAFHDNLEDALIEYKEIYSTPQEV
jgi:hypothetical protein